MVSNWFFTVPECFFMVFQGSRLVFFWFKNVVLCFFKVPGWFFTVSDGIFWFFKVPGWFFTVPGGFLWFQVGFHGFSRFQVGF